MTHSISQNPKKSITRLTLIILAGALVTFLLFAAMHAMIKQDIVITKELEDPIFISSILDIQETETIEPQRLKPPPILIEPPKTERLIEQEPAGETTFSNYINPPNINIANATEVNLGNFDAQPRPMVRTDPQYPVDAARDGIEGYVALSFGVSASGQVTDIEIIEAEPKRVFDRAAKRALSNWRYQPKKVDGTAVAMSGLQVRLDFTLAK